MDFDDLLLNWKILLAEREPVRRALAGAWQHVLVDEYQDTNRLQGDVVDLVAAEHRNLCVVGDDAQSIYAFRGAHFANILEFEKRYPDARRFDLTVNYRSTPQILSLANASHRRERPAVREGAARASARRGRCRRWCRAGTSCQQAAFVAQRVLELRDEGIPLPEIAVLYRAHHHAMEIQFELARRGHPFRRPERRPLLRGRPREGRPRPPPVRPEPGRRARAEALPAPRAGRRQRHRRGGLERLRRRGAAAARGRSRSSSRRTSRPTSRPRGARGTAGWRSCCGRWRASPPATSPARRSRRCWTRGTRSTSGRSS